MSAMFEFCHLHCEYAKLHVPLSLRLNEFMIQLMNTVCSNYQCGSNKLVHTCNHPPPEKICSNSAFNTASIW